MNPRLYLLLILLALGKSLFAQPGEYSAPTPLSSTLVDATSQEPLVGVTVELLTAQDSLHSVVTTDVNGTFSVLVASEVAQLRFRYLGYDTQRLRRDQVEKRVLLAPSAVELAAVTVMDASRGDLAQSTLNDVDGVAIYAGRKTELILPDKIQANLATNNPRELYKGVAGLTVWESDGAGLQLSIGARGLNPNRSSNFNTRQNGFDISADALGYPESYYTPPAQALQRVELVRGAASLQYGTQFGGLLNFKLKEGDPNRKAAIVSEQTVGSFGLFNSFNSVGGTVGKVNYYGFAQYKRGNAWRDNSNFEQATGYLDVHYQVSSKLRVGLELTRMNYLAQQPGGLVDFEFERSPRTSKRARNYFQVDWGLAALHLDYEFSDATKLNVRTFVLDAQRDALGELGPINRPDPMRERNLVEGKYRNFGQEVRLLHRFKLLNKPATLVLGTRVYSGLTTNRQGLASAESDADFSFLSADSLQGSDYRFPSRNYAAFAEQLINLGERWTLTPGLRYEYIRTAADGYYARILERGGEVLLYEQVGTDQRNARQFVIGGLGIGYRPTPLLEVYANGSQNFRAINFSDLVVINPNLVIDSTLADERGYNLELGFRGSSYGGAWRFDASAFLLSYDNRIGVREILVPDVRTVEREVSLRTNIGAARLYGLELYSEVDVFAFAKTGRKSLSLRPFINLSLIHGEYTSGVPSVVGNEIEYVPPISLKTGFSASWKNLSGQFLYTFVQEHFSDATNAIQVADATRGTIPSYQVVDVTANYTWKMFRFQIGINNLLDARYFTRRATGYPGPGIIPAEARSVYAGLRLTL